MRFVTKLVLWPVGWAVGAIGVVLWGISDLFNKR